MATVTKKKLLTNHLPFSNTPYGNKATVRAEFETSAAGVYVNGDASAAVGVGDKVRLAVLQGGMELHDALALVNDAFTATSTAKLGFEYVDGVDSADVPQDDDYFFAALDLATLARARASNTGVRPVVLPKDAYLILTNQVAAQAAAGKVDFIIDGAIVGRP